MTRPRRPRQHGRAAGVGGALRHSLVYGPSSAGGLGWTRRLPAVAPSLAAALFWARAAAGRAVQRIRVRAGFDFAHYEHRHSVWGLKNHVGQQRIEQLDIPNEGALDGGAEPARDDADEDGEEHLGSAEMRRGQTPAGKWRVFSLYVCCSDAGQRTGRRSRGPASGTKGNAVRSAVRCAELVATDVQRSFSLLHAASTQSAQSRRASL